MLDIMKKTKGILDNLDIVSWLDCGTLLKMYRDREPDLLDCDMAIYAKDVNKLLQNLDVFLNDEYKLYKLWTHPKLGVVEISLLCRQKKVDIFVKFYDGDITFQVNIYDKVQSVGKFPKRHFYPLTLYTLDEAISLGEPYYWQIPNRVEEYLEIYYGKNWRTPKDKWKYYDAPCTDFNYLKNKFEG